MRGVFAHQLKGSLADTKPTHAVVYASRPQTLLRDCEACALLSQEILLRHATVLIPDFGVARIIASLIAHHVGVAHNVKALRISRHDNLAGSLVTVFGG